MYLFEPSEEQPCFYCKRITDSQPEDEYPVRSASFTFENYIYRCTWHARFRCFQCNNMHHFSSFYWCPSKIELICNECKSYTLKPVKFWDRTTAFEFYCDKCDENHYDLLYAEFMGIHPWQNRIKNLSSVVEEENPWEPIWMPDGKRLGIEITLEEALQMENNAFKYRKFKGNKFYTDTIPEDEISHEETQKRWEKASSDWIKAVAKNPNDDYDYNRQLVIDPAMWEILGDIKDLKVLDAGCGNGYFSRKMARKGANVIGVDFSQQLIDFCQQRSEELSIRGSFYQASLTDLSVFEDRTFDLVISIVVMVDVLDYKTAFKEIKRVLKENGRFILCNSHPAFGRIGAVDFKLPLDTPRKEERLAKIIDRYFDSGGTLMSWGDLKPIWQFDRTLEEYSQALKQAGFVISEIVEPRPDIELMREYPFLAFDFERFSQFIILECHPFDFEKIKCH